ncbi:MAG: SRPBCC family protein [Pyrinomonadaceae bacterium]
MFTVKAGYSNDIEVASSIDKVRDFFSDIKNFAELMPGVQQIYTDAKGVAHLKIHAEIPVVGAMLQNFSIELADQSEDRIEWSPIAAEAQNFLRYSADFLEKAKNVTLVHFSQAVELRREKARDLHFLAGMAGEAIISSEMTKRFAEMVKVFIEKAKQRLEG